MLNPVKLTMKLIPALFFAFCVRLFAEQAEYQILWEDISNVSTSGYQSRLDRETFRGIPVLPGYIQASLVNGPSHYFAILGAGFFKLILDDGSIGWTRDGRFSFSFDEAGNYFLIPYPELYKNFKLADKITFYISVTKNDYVNNTFEVVDVILADNEKTFYSILNGNIRADKYANNDSRGLAWN